MTTSEVSLIDPCTSDEWMQFVSTHPDAGIFHHPVWMKMLRDIYGYTMFAVCLRDGGRIRAGIPFADVRSFVTGKRWVSLPFSDYCQPLLPMNDPQAIVTLLGYLKMQQGKVIPKIEIRWDVESSEKLFTEENFVNHTLALQADPEVLFKKFSKSTTQRHIRSSERNGLTLKQCTTYDEFLEFYRLQVVTRRRHGVPAQPKKFFRGVWDYILQPGHGFCTVAYKDGKAVASGVFFRFGRTTYYKYGASDYLFRSLNPNYAIMWEAIKQACGEGYSVFDLGRSEKDNEGLRRFKRGWGTEERSIPYTLLMDNPPKPGGSKLESLVGTVIRNSPEFVCTMSGELFYRHFA